MEQLTRYELISLVIGGVQALSTIAAFVALAWTVRQLRDGVRWNRLNAALTYLDIQRTAEVESKAVAALMRIGIDFNDPGKVLTRDEAKSILQTPEVYEPVKQLLNLLESSAAAIRIGAIDEEYVYSQMCYYYSRCRKCFASLMIESRQRKNNDECWSEIDRLTYCWEKKRKDAAGHGGVIKPRYGEVANGSNAA